MKILITTFSFPTQKLGHYDGKFVLAEANGYAENGAFVKVLTPHYPGSQNFEILENGVEIIRFTYFWPIGWQCLKQPGKPIYDSRSTLALLQIPFALILFSFHIFRLAKWADLIHSQWTITGLLALPAKFFYKIPIVMTARGSDLRLLPKWLNCFIHKHVTAAIDCWGPQPTMMAFRKLYPAKYIKLPLIVEYRPSRNMPKEIQKVIFDKKDLFSIVYVGRLVKLKLDQKNLFINLIDAINKIDKELNFHVFLIGDGEQEIIDLIKQKISAYNIGSSVSLLGGKLNVSDYIQNADLGIGGQALNAVSQEFIVAKVPQILTKGDRNTEAIWTHEHNAFLVDNTHSDALASIISKLILDRDLTMKIARNASADMSKYVLDVSDGGKQYLAAFKEIVYPSNH